MRTRQTTRPDTSQRKKETLIKRKTSPTDISERNALCPQLSVDLLCPITHIMYSESQQGTFPTAAKSSLLPIRASANPSHLYRKYTVNISIDTSNHALHNADNKQLKRIRKPTPNKVNHLQPVPPIQRSSGPPGTRNNLPIMLNRHPVALQTKFPDQLFKASSLRKRLEVTGLAIQNHRQ